MSWEKHQDFSHLSKTQKILDPSWFHNSSKEGLYSLSSHPPNPPLTLLHLGLCAHQFPSCSCQGHQHPPLKSATGLSARTCPSPSAALIRLATPSLKRFPPLESRIISVHSLSIAHSLADTVHLPTSGCRQPIFSIYFHSLGGLNPS